MALTRAPNGGQGLRGAAPAAARPPAVGARRRLVRVGAAIALCLLALGGVGAGRAAADQASSYQENAGHTGFASGGSLGAPPLTRQWSVALGGTLSSPLIGGGMTFVVQSGLAQSPTLLALSNATGAVVWSRPTLTAPALAYDSGRLFVVDPQGELVAIDAASGRRVWSRALARSTFGVSLVAQNGVVHVSTETNGGGLYALREADGSQIWLQPSSAGELFADGRFVYATDWFPDGYVRAFDQNAGRSAWGAVIPCTTSPTPGWGSDDGARLLLGAECPPPDSPATSVLDTATGALRSHFATAGPVAVVGPTSVYLVAVGGALQARDLVTGAPLWHFLAANLDTPPLIVNDAVYVESSTGALFAVSLDTGARVWSAEVAPAASLSAGPQPGMAAAQGLLVVPYGGTLTAFGGGTVRGGLDLQIESGPDGPTDASSATFSFGSSDPSVPTSCRLDDGAWSACVSPAVLTGLTEGSHTFEVRTVDPASGATVALAARGWSVLTRVPPVRIDAAPPPLTNQYQAHLAWSAADPNTTFQCSIDAGPFSSCGFSGDGYLDDGFNEGTHTFAVESVNELGDVQATPTTTTWTFSAQPPTTRLRADVSDPTRSRSATFVFWANKASTFKCSLDFEPYHPCSSPVRASHLSDGLHDFSVQATDRYGNAESNPPELSWTVSHTPPSVSFLPPFPTGTTTDRNPVLQFTSGLSTDPTCSLDGGPFIHCRPPVYLSDLAYGAHTFRVIGTDLAGNVSRPAQLHWSVAPASSTSAAMPRTRSAPRPSSVPPLDQAGSFQENAGHTGFASGGSLDAPPLVQAWQLDLGGAVSAPLIGEGHVFVLVHTPGAASETLDAIDASTGAIGWSRTTDPAEIALDAGTVFLSDSQGLVTAINAITGVTLWTHQLPAPFTPTMPVATGGVLYVDSAWSGGYVYALREVDGSRIWAAPEYVSADLAAAGGYVFAAYGGIDALTQNNGHHSWSSGIDCFGLSGGTSADGARVTWGEGDCGAEFDAATGAMYDTAPMSAASATAGDTGVFLNGSTLQARDLSTGLLKWQFTGDAALDSPPLIVNNTAYAASGNGTLFAVNLDTGAQLWSGSAPASSLSQAGPTPGLAAAQGILVWPFGGTLTAYRSAATRPGLDLRILTGPDGPTTSTSATITFASSDPLAPTSCSLDGSAWTPCISPYLVGGLADGPHTLEVRTTDPADGSTVGLAAAGWSVLTTVPPAQITSAPAPLVNTRTATFAFSSSDANATFQCSLDGGAYRPCGGPGSGSVVEHAGDGTHAFSVRAVGELGALQAPPTTASWTIDTTRPRVSLSGSAARDTRAQTASFTFAADEQATFLCTLDADPPVACTSPYLVRGLVDGPHRFVVQATDVAGNVGQSAPFAWTVRTTPPVTNLEGPHSGTYINQPFSIYFSTDDPAATFTCSLDGGQFRRCRAPLELSGLADGPHSFRVLATDGAGNVERTPAEADWTFVAPPSTTPPVTTIDSESVSGDTATVAFHSDQPVTFRCSIDSGQWLPCASPVSYTHLAPGGHELSVQGANSGGVADVTPASVSFTIAPGYGVTPKPPAPMPGVPPFPTTTSPSPPGPAPIDARSLLRGLAGLIAQELRHATRRQLLRGFSLTLAAPGPGRIMIALRGRNGRHRVLGRARIDFTASGSALGVLRLSRAGRRAMRARSEPAVVVIVSWVHSGGTLIVRRPSRI